MTVYTLLESVYNDLEVVCSSRIATGYYQKLYAYIKFIILKFRIEVLQKYILQSLS